MDKICRVCGVDCSNKPRTKDSKGRYYCKACYEKVLRAKKAKAAQQKQEESGHAASGPPSAEPQPARAPAPAPDGRPKFEGSLLDAGPEDETFELDELIPGGEPPKLCHDCGAEVPFDSVICTSCGFNFLTGRSLPTPANDADVVKKKRRRKERSGELLGQLTTPGGLAFLVLVAFGVLLVGSFLHSAFILAYALAWVLLWLVVLVWTIIAAFKEGLLHGVASLLFCPYALVFLFVFCEDSRPKLLFATLVLAIGGMAAVAVILGPENLPLPAGSP